VTKGHTVPDPSFLRPRIALAFCLALAASTPSAVARAQTAGAAPDDTRWNSPAMAITGSVLAGIGLAQAGVGVALLATNSHDEGGMGVRSGLGGLALLGGGLFVAAGTPLIVAGAWQIPAGSGAAALAPAARLRVGAGSVELSGTF
jgi:hypothetical protein